MKFGKKEKETQEEEVVRGEIQRVVPDYRVGLNPEQIRIWKRMAGPMMRLLHRDLRQKRLFIIIYLPIST